MSKVTSNENIKMHMSTIHSRVKNKTVVKRAFSLVMNGVLISSVLLSSIALAGCQSANGATVSDKVPIAITQQVNAEDEVTYITNLNMAIKAINDVIASNGWTTSTFDSFYKTIIGIEVKLNTDGFKNTESLVTTIKEADKTVSNVDATKLESIGGLKEKHTNTKDTINRIKNKLGIVAEEEVKTSTADKVEVTLETKLAQAKPLEISETKSVVLNETKKEVKATPVSVEVPSKYKGYTKVSTRLATVTVNEEIYVKYGKHTYGCKNQAEYDKVLAKVESTVANAEKLVWGEKQQWDYTQTMNKVKYTTYPKDSREYNRLKFFQGNYVNAIMNLSPENSKNFIMGGLVWSHLVANKYSDPEDGSPNSAYNILFERVGDCDAQSQLAIAIFDVMGYSTRITMPSTTHATASIKVEKYWLDYVSNDPVNPNPPANTILVAPTF